MYNYTCLPSQHNYANINILNMKIFVKKSVTFTLVVVIIVMLTYETAPNLVNWRGPEDIGYNIIPLAIIGVGIYAICRIFKK